MKNDWAIIVEVLEKHDCDLLFLIECIYAYYSILDDDDSGLIKSLQNIREGI